MNSAFFSSKTIVAGTSFFRIAAEIATAKSGSPLMKIAPGLIWERSTVWTIWTDLRITCAGIGIVVAGVGAFFANNVATILSLTPACFRAIIPSVVVL